MKTEKWDVIVFARNIKRQRKWTTGLSGEDVSEVNTRGTHFSDIKIGLLEVANEVVVKVVLQTRLSLRDRCKEVW